MKPALVQYDVLEPSVKILYVRLRLRKIMICCDRKITVEV